MFVPRVVRAARVRRRASGRIGARDFERMLVDVALVHMMQMSVVQVVDVPRVLHLRVRAARAVIVFVLFVNRMCHAAIIACLRGASKNSPPTSKSASQ